MATATIAIVVDPSRASTPARTIRKDLDDIADAGARAERGAARMGQTANDNLRQMSRSAQMASESFRLLAASIVALGLGALVANFIRMADAMTKMTSQLRLVTKSTAELADVQEKLFRMAQASRSDLEATVTLYTRLARSTADMKLGQEKLLSVTDTINKAFVVSGASAEEAANAIRQLSQGLASGALRGDEFNAVAEQAPIILDAIAASTGRSRGELRKLAADGKITGDVIVQSMLNMREKIDADFSKMALTVGQSMTVLGNSVTNAVGQIDKYFGISSGIAKGIIAISSAVDVLAGNLELVADVAYVAGVALFTAFGPTIAGAVVSLAVALGTTVMAAIRAISAAMMANPILAIITALMTAIAVAYRFRDEIKKAIGIDIPAIAKDVGNTIIGVFVGAYEAVVATWNQLPAAFLDIFTMAMNFAIDKVQAGVNAIVGALNVIPGVDLETADLSGFKGTSSGAAGQVLDKASGAFKSAMAVDYIGQLSSAMTTLSQASTEAIGPTAEVAANVSLGAGSADKASKAFANLTKNARDQIAELKVQAQTVGMGTRALEGMRFEQELLNKATDNGRKLTPALRAEIRKLADEYGAAKEALAEATLANDLMFEAQTVSFSRVEQFVAGSMRDLYGNEWQSHMDSALAKQIRMNDVMARSKERLEDVQSVIGSSIGDALNEVFSGGIKSFDEFLDHVTEGFASIAENSIAGLFDFSAEGILAGLGQGGASGDPWAGTREIGSQIADGVEKGAQTGTATGLVSVFKMFGMSNSGATAAGGVVGAAAGGFGAGYQSANPLMGAVQGGLGGLGLGVSLASSGVLTGALAGSMVMPVIGTIVGAIAGALGGLLGSASEKKQEKADAAAQLKTQNAALTQILQVGQGKGVGEYQKNYQEFEDSANKLQSLAHKAGDPRFSEIGDAIDNTFNIMNKEFLGRLEGFNQALRDGLGKNSPFEQGRTAIMGMREELKGWIADVEYMSRKAGEVNGTGLSEAEIQNRIVETQRAAQQYALAQLTGAKELSSVAAEILRVQGAAVALQDTLEQLGMSSEEAATAIADGVNVAMQKLRDSFMAGVDSRFYDASGKGYLNDLRDEIAATKAMMQDSAALGDIGIERIRETFMLLSQTIVDDAGLSADQVAEANRVLADALAEIGLTVPQAMLESAEEVAKSFDRNALSAKINSANGKGYLNQFTDLQGEIGTLMKSASSIADAELIGQYSIAAARQIAESSGLTSDALRGLADDFPQFARSLVSVADEMDDAAKRAAAAERAAQAAAAAAARRAAILGLTPGLLERTQGQAASQDWQLDQLRVGNASLSGIRSAGSITEARQQLEAFIATIKRTGMSAEDITGASQLAYQVFDDVAASLENAAQSAAGLVDSLTDLSVRVTETLTANTEKLISELKSTFDSGWEDLRRRRDDFYDAAAGARSYVYGLATDSTNPQGAFAIEQQRFRSAAAAAQGGDPGALRGLTSQADSYRQAAQQFYPGGTLQYHNIVEEIRSVLGTGADAAEDRGADVAEKMDDLLDAYNAQKAQLESLLEEYRKTVGDAFDALIEELAQQKDATALVARIVGELTDIMGKDKVTADLVAAVVRLTATETANGDKLDKIASRIGRVA